ncbi:MAG: hypothetical protein VX951_11760 [Planctomycetota bacterium]|nr:hypothetical protein [Planctomycetota bacterium]
MQLSLRSLVTVTSLVVTASCSGPPAPVVPVEPTSPGPEAGLLTARALVRAAPADWQSHWQRLRKMDKSATPAILRALREQPEGHGSQAAIHLLGEAADVRAKTFLLELLHGGDERGAEAALALGKLADTTTIGSLKTAAQSAATPMTTRAAAAAALVTMGEGPSVVSFLEAIFLAASPYASASSRQHKIPANKTRWAHERYMIIEALRGRYRGETFGLDEDSSWPAMRAAAAKMAKRLRRK